jgi:hypothetical protein
MSSRYKKAQRMRQEFVKNSPVRNKRTEAHPQAKACLAGLSPAVAAQGSLEGSRLKAAKPPDPGGFEKNDIESRTVVTENPPIPADSSASGCCKMANSSTGQSLP